MEPALSQDPETPKSHIAEHLPPVGPLLPAAVTAAGTPASPYLLPGAVVIGMGLIGLFYFVATIYRPTMPPALSTAYVTPSAPTEPKRKTSEQDADEVQSPKVATKQAALTSLRALLERVTAERREASSSALKNVPNAARFDDLWAARLGWGTPDADALMPSAFVIWHGGRKFTQPSNYNHMWALGGELSRLRLRLLELTKSDHGVASGRGTFDYYGNYAVYITGYISPFKSGDVVDLYGYISDLYKYETIANKQLTIPGFAVLAAMKPGTGEKARAAYLNALVDLKEAELGPQTLPSSAESGHNAKR